jgi:hypothetical protein
MQQAIFVDTITLTVSTMYTNKITSFDVLELLTDHRSEYRFFTITNKDFKDSGVGIMVRRRNTSTVLDFNVVNITSIEKIGLSNRKYFLKGAYHILDGKFKNVSTGGEFNDKLMVDSFDTLLTKSILELISFICKN